MSFINNREKLFKSKSTSHAVKKMTTGRMKTASSFTDPRAWSLDPRERSSFIMDAMAEMASSSGGEDNCVDVIPKIETDLQFPDNGRKAKILLRDHIVDDTDHDLIKLSNKLFEAKSKIEELQSLNDDLLKEKTSTTAEVDNLRVLVTNMREQMKYLESLGASDGKLKTDDALETAAALEDAKLEIDHLTKEIEIYSEMCQWHSNLRNVQDKLVEEKKELSKTVKELYAEKERLSEELKKRQQEVSALEVELKARAQGSFEKSLLRDKVAAKDREIQELNSVIGKQATNIEELKEAISIMTERCQNKEDLLNQEIEQLKATLEEKTAKITQLEAKLHDTELLVAELEALRDQFRSTNIALGESVAAYKKDIENAMNVSNDLAETVRELRAVNEAKDREIEKLTLFPQNPDTMLYFSQLNKLVTSAEDFRELETGRRFERLRNAAISRRIIRQSFRYKPHSTEEQMDLMESIKKVIVKLKTEMWGSNVTPIELQIQDISVQAEPERSDNEIQCYPATCSIELQTALPDEYLVMVNHCEEEVSRLNLKMSNYERKLTEQAAEFDSLENSLFDAIEENYSKEVIIGNAERNRELLEDTLEVFNKELKNKDQMLAKALTEIHEQTENCKTLREILETTLQATVAEYSEYVGVLETYLEFKDSQIYNIQEASKQNELVQDETIERITKENVDLRSRLENERAANAELNNQVVCLMKSLREKIARAKETEEKLERAEATIRKIVDSEGYKDDGSSGDYERVINLRSQLTACKFDLRKQLEANRDLVGEIARLKMSKRSAKNLLTKNAERKKQNDTKILRMAARLRKVNKRGAQLKDELSKRESEKSEMSVSLEELKGENDVLKKERSMLLQELYTMKNRICEAETSLEKYKEKEITHEELKMKMERMVLKLMKKVTKYKTEVNDRRDLEEKFKNHLAMNEQLYHEIDMLKNENLSLSTTICGFEQKLSTLMELPQKESSSVELQVSLEESSSDGFRCPVGLQSHYESVIATMKKDYDETSRQSHKQYTSNLKMLRDTYERDIANMKKTHSENLIKIQIMHAEELRHQSQKGDWESEKFQLEQLHNEELAGLKRNFEAVLKKKEAAFEDEKRFLSEEIVEVRKEFTKIHQETSNEIEVIKGKFRDQIVKIEELQSIERELLKRKFEQQIESEIGKRMNEMKPSSAEKGTQSYGTVHQSSGTNPDLSINTKESFTNTENSDTSIIISCNVEEERTESFQSLPRGAYGVEFSAMPERLLLLSRIAELEKTAQMQQMEYARKIKLYEKRLKHEQMKAKEIAHILDQELRYSTDVHCKLGMQYNRAEQLELEKETLASRVLLYEQQLALMKKGEVNTNRPAITYDKGLVAAERELELSLNRLKEKIELAVEQEKRVSTAGKKTKQKSGDRDNGMDRIPHRETTKNSATDEPDMKVIVIQQHKITHAWSSQIDSVYS